MGQLIFKSSPYFIIVCLAIGIAYSIILYSAKNSWGIGMNRLLFALRAILVTTLLIVILNPIVKHTKNIILKPTVAFLVDNSKSLGKTVDTTNLQLQLSQLSQKISENQDVEWYNLFGRTDSIVFNGNSSDIATAIKETISQYEGRNLSGIVFVSDGIYNQGLSPLYLPIHIPVYTVAVGDTVKHTDAFLKNVKYNRVAYQGNKFRLEVEVGLSNLPNQEITVSVLNKGKVLHQVKKNSSNNKFLDFDFQIEASTIGLQRWQIQVSVMPGEVNVSNNFANVFVEVVGGKKKILLLSPSPHPDIKSLRMVIYNKLNFEFILHIPNVNEADPQFLSPDKIDLLIAFQSPDIEGKTTSILSNFLNAKSSVLLIVGGHTKTELLSKMWPQIKFEYSNQKAEVQTTLNLNFHDLGFKEDMQFNINRFPPVMVPFGEFTYPANAQVILNQKIGTIVTNRPLLFSWEIEKQKMAVLLGDGIWRWRINEFRETNKTDTFDELFFSLIQYLSTHNDRKKFRVFTVKQEFNQNESVVFESQVFNDLYEPSYGHSIDLELKDEQDKLSSFHFITSLGNERYSIPRLKEGVYHYKAMTKINNKNEVVSGQFFVNSQNQEAQNTTADFALLESLATKTGGQFSTLKELNNIPTWLSKRSTKKTIHTEESFLELINLKIVFYLLLIIVSLEWVLRKYFGTTF